MLPRSVDRVTLAAFLVAVVILGVNWVGVRFSNRELPPFWGAALRFALAKTARPVTAVPAPTAPTAP